MFIWNYHKYFFRLVIKIILSYYAKILLSLKFLTNFPIMWRDESPAMEKGHIKKRNTECRRISCTNFYGRQRTSLGINNYIGKHGPMFLHLIDAACGFNRTGRDLILEGGVRTWPFERTVPESPVFLNISANAFRVGVVRIYLEIVAISNTPLLSFYVIYFYFFFLKWRSYVTFCTL